MVSVRIQGVFKKVFSVAFDSFESLLKSLDEKF